jgi:hypothetical protein
VASKTALATGRIEPPEPAGAVRGGWEHDVERSGRPVMSRIGWRAVGAGNPGAAKATSDNARPCPGRHCLNAAAQPSGLMISRNHGRR